MKNQIGWQKYEDMVQNQMNSPLMQVLYQQAQEQAELAITNMSEEEVEILREAIEAEETGDYEIQQGSYQGSEESLAEHINLSANFDCWLGHTNFNITPKVLDIIEATEGVELLKICSRYRFFVGVGRMFDFKEVRTSIEKTLIQEKNIESEN